MPAIIRRLTTSGLDSVDYSAGSLREAAKYEAGQGVYTVSNTYNSTQTLLLNAHLDRLEDSAFRQGIALRYDRGRLRNALRKMIVDSGFGNVRYRISVPADAPDELILSIELFVPPAPEIVCSGVRCVTTGAAARSNPLAKSSEWIHQREALLAAMPSGIYETFLTDKRGGILEGMSSNFYAIKGGELQTAGAGVLAGISRKIVLEICSGIIKLRAQSPQLSDIHQFSEAFLTSSSRGIIPVIEIDGCDIGGGAVGAKTRALREAYDRWVMSHLEEL